jgi:hypothetical protein
VRVLRTFLALAAICAILLRTISSAVARAAVYWVAACLQHGCHPPKEVNLCNAPSSAKKWSKGEFKQGASVMPKEHDAGQVHDLTTTSGPLALVL